MSLRILPHGAFTPRPWQNGGGTTREIACGRLGAARTEEESGAAWHWRLSLADIAADGPFSTFPSIDRLLTVVSGAGIELHVAGQVSRRLGPGEDIEFPGDAEAMCRLLAGPTQDLNLMVDRRVARLVPGRAERGLRASAGDVVLLYALEEVCVQAETGQLRIAAGDALQASGPWRAEWISGQAIWARVEPRDEARADTGCDRRPGA